MRSHNHLEVKKVCQDCIPTLMQKHDLGRIQSVEKDSEGWVNPCFFVNQKYVFRFNARDPLLPKYQREKYLYDLLKTSDIPVPQKVILDDSKTLSPYDVLITELIDGQNLEKHWNELDVQTKEALSFSAGNIQKKLHQIVFPFFGEITNRGPFPQTSKWIHFLQAKLTYHLDEAKGLHLFSDSTLQKIWNVFEQRSTFINEVQSSSLIHLDFHLGNLLFKKNDIAGVLDFEWAIAGDPLYDFCRWRTKDDEVLSGSRESFLNGYGKTEFNESELKRMDLYQMIFNIEITVVSFLHFEKEEAQSYLEKTLNSIDRLFLEET